MDDYSFFREGTYAVGIVNYLKSSSSKFERNQIKRNSVV